MVFLMKIINHLSCNVHVNLAWTNDTSSSFFYNCSFWFYPCWLDCLVNAESLTALFKHIWNVEEPSQDDTIRDKVLCFIRDKVQTASLFTCCWYSCALSCDDNWGEINRVYRFFLLKLNSWDPKRKWKGT